MTDFAHLVQTESRGLVAAVTAIVGDAQRAEEIVQDAFERCFRRWNRVSHYDRPGAWARRVAINQAISVTRRRANERGAIERLGARQTATATSHVFDDPFAAIEHDEIWQAVRALPRDQAAAIALHYGADLSLEEVAATLDRTVPAVKSLLHRGRAALRESPLMIHHAPLQRAAPLASDRGGHDV